MSTTTDNNELTLAAQMMAVLDRLAAGESFNQVIEETGITARVSEAIQREKRPVFILIQEGGSSTELYIHSHDSKEEAEEDRISCARDGAYRTSEVIELPGPVAALGEAFYEVAEELLRATHDLECVDIPADEEGDQFAEVLQHRIRWHLKGDEAPSELPDEAIEHIETQIREDFREGELIVSGDEPDISFRGWWAIDNS